MALILSKATIVSFIEYHNIVRSAVIKNVSILNSGIKLEVSIYSQLDITTSWKSVIIVIKAKLKDVIPETEPENA